MRNENYVNILTRTILNMWYADLESAIETLENFLDVLRSKIRINLYEWADWKEVKSLDEVQKVLYEAYQTLDFIMEFFKDIDTDEYMIIPFSNEIIRQIDEYFNEDDYTGFLCYTAYIGEFVDYLKESINKYIKYNKVLLIESLLINDCSGLRNIHTQSFELQILHNL